MDLLIKCGASDEYKDNSGNTCHDLLQQRSDVAPCINYVPQLNEEVSDNTKFIINPENPVNAEEMEVKQILCSICGEHDLAFTVRGINLYCQICSRTKLRKFSLHEC